MRIISCLFKVLLWMSFVVASVYVFDDIAQQIGLLSWQPIHHVFDNVYGFGRFVGVVVRLIDWIMLWHLVCPSRLHSLSTCPPALPIGGHALRLHQLIDRPSLEFPIGHHEQF